MPRIVPQNAPGTKGLRRHSALVSLSRDHHGALMQALWLRRAGESPSRQGAAAAAAEFLAVYRSDLVGHFADEEEVVLPLAGHADAEGAARIRGEHRELQALALKLGEAASLGADLRPLALEIGQLLDDHVRFEERSFFMAVQATLSSAELAALDRALREHREARGAILGCALPRPAGSSD